MERRAATRKETTQKSTSSHYNDPNRKVFKGRQSRDPIVILLLVTVAGVCFSIGYSVKRCDERLVNNSPLEGIVQQQNEVKVERNVQTPSTVISPKTKELHRIGEGGGAWTAETHLRKYGFNVDAGLVDVIEESCREIENNRQTDGTMWSQHPGNGPIHGLWRPPTVVDCRVLELGPGVGVYVDSLKKDAAKKKRKVYGIEPNPMRGTFERRNGPKQLAINILDHEDSYVLAKQICKDELNGESFDLVYSIEVCEHMPPERHEDAAKFLAGLSRKGTKLIFGAAHRGQAGTGHIGNRPKEEWEGKLDEVKVPDAFWSDF
jgi:SAM-dependent methyltransferase